MNIIVSGWPGSGTSTLAILMASLLDYKFLDAGSILKYFARQIVQADSGENFIFFENNYGPYWDKIWDKYAIWKINHTDNLLLEAKTAGFFVDSEEVFEIMVIATTESRIERAEHDGRAQAAETIVARDEDVRNRWWKESQIDLYSPKQIRDNYDLVLDNSSMSINKELEIIFKDFEEDYRFPFDDLGRQKKQIDAHVNKFLTDGKETFLQSLSERNLLITPKQVFTDWQNQFKDELASLPIQMQDVVKHDLST